MPAKLILFTGGGTAGHVTPNLAIMADCAKLGWESAYIGSVSGIEKDIMERAGVRYSSIQTGKLRRYFSLRNFADLLRIAAGVLQACWIVRRLRPRVLFSKGGFVSFPVVVGAWVNRVPVIIHESDFSPGLATKLCAPLATRICVTFAETKEMLAPGHREKAMVTGTPIRSELLQGSREKGLELCGFSGMKPMLMVFGGSQGSEIINLAVWRSLERLLKSFDIAHICGPGKIDPQIAERPGYRQFEYLHGQFGDVMRAADAVVSRAGANSLYELLALRKPNLLIPLARRASRGDQIHNARFFEKAGLSLVLSEEELTEEKLAAGLERLLKESREFESKMSAIRLPDSASAISALISELGGTGV